MKLLPSLGENDFERLINSLPLAVIACNDQGAILACSAVFCDLVSLTSQELESGDLFLSCPEFSRDSYTTCLRRGGSFLLPWGKSKPLLLVASPLTFELPGIHLFQLSPAGANVLGAVGGSQQSSLESLGTLVGSVAHDLNNILTSVLGHVSFLRMALAGMDFDRSSLSSIEEGTRRAAGIAQRILDYTRGSTIPSANLADLGAVVEGALLLVRSSIPEGISLDYNQGPARLEVAADESELSQIVINLAINARDAVGDVGKIAVDVSPLILEEGVTVRGRQLSAGTYAVLSLADDGCGIPEEYRDRIFEPFFTTKAERGTGLGLSIVSTLTESIGGALEVESSRETGTEFRIYLPAKLSSSVAVDANSAEQRFEEQRYEAPSGSECILVVDDEDAVRTVVQRSLEHLGYEVFAASNGAEALEIYRDNPDRFRLIIIDMIMPGMAGDELFKRLKEVNKEAPVLVASGYSSDSRTRFILENGGLGYIQKPFAVEELAREVRRCLDL